MYSVNLTKTEQGGIDPLRFDTAESFDLEFTIEGLFAGCGSLVFKSIKRSVLNLKFHKVSGFSNFKT